MYIRIRRKTTAEWICILVLAMTFLFPTLHEFLRIPSAVKYVVDISCIYLFACILRRIRWPFNIDIRRLLLIVLLFFALSSISFLVNFQSPIYFLWGFRNNVRFFVFFFACIFYIHPKNVDYYLQLLEKLFWLNAIVVAFQYFVMGYTQDYLGGIFGVQRGSNGYTNFFLLIMSAKTILELMNKKRMIRSGIMVVGISLVIAVLAEIKVFIIELLMILLLASAITGVSVRKIWILLLLAVAAMVGGIAIGRLFPVFDNWYDWNRLLLRVTSASGYTGSGDMNRMTVVPIALNTFLDSIWEKLFGLGLGNCDYGAPRFLQTPFYRMYKETHYIWFSTGFLILETGLIGLLLYIVFFVQLYFMVRRRRKQKCGNLLYTQLAEIIAILCVVQIFYNGAMRTEAAYMMYFVLALPFMRSSPKETRVYQQVEEGGR